MGAHGRTHVIACRVEEERGERTEGKELMEWTRLGLRLLQLRDHEPTQEHGPELAPRRQSLPVTGDLLMLSAAQVTSKLASKALLSY